MKGFILLTIFGVTIATKLLSLEPERVKRSRAEKSQLCEICELIIDEIDALVEQNANITTINETIYDLCNRVPSVYQEVCKQVAPQFVREIAQGVDHTTVCAKIGLCPSSRQGRSVVDEPAEPVEQEQEEGSALVEEFVQPLLCDACVKTVSTLYNTMQSDYPKVQPSLARLCDHLPEKYQYTCGLFVDADKGLYFKKFLEKVNPEVLCDAIQCQ